MYRFRMFVPDAAGARLAEHGTSSNASGFRFFSVSLKIKVKINHSDIRVN